MSRESLTAEVHQRLGYRRLNRTRAKAEIGLGLFAAATGLFLGQYAVTRPAPAWTDLAVAVSLFVLGGYLTLAGHRSHLYQSSLEGLVLAIEEMRQMHSKGSAI